jgi:hypothetical protein
MNHVETLLGSAQNLKRERSEAAPKLKRHPKFSLTRRVILILFFHAKKKEKGVAALANSRHARNGLHTHEAGAGWLGC